MGLKCSLLGHRFGDPDVEREREERGSEVVTTTREVAVCERCEEKRVLSENKEVTAVIDESELGDSDGVGDVGGSGEGGAASGSGPGSEPEPDGDDLVSEAVKNVQAERDASGGMADIEVPGEDEGAEIMSDDGDEKGERGYGEWPTEPGEDPEPWDQEEPDAGGATAGSSGPTADDRTEREDAASGREQPSSDDERPFGTGSAEDVTPDTGAEIIDDAGDARPGDPSADAGQSDAEPGGAPDASPTGGHGDGSEIIDAEERQAGEPAAGERSPGGRTGESGAADGTVDRGAAGRGGDRSGGVGDGGDGADGDSGHPDDGDSGGDEDGSGAGSESSFEETEAASPSRPDAYKCPECGFETGATNSPLRAGDPCPECSAYLVGSERKT